MGVVINSTQTTFEADGACNDELVDKQLQIMTDQVLEFCQMSH